LNAKGKTSLILLVLAAVFLLLKEVVWLSIGLLLLFFCILLSISRSESIIRFKKMTWVSFPLLFIAMLFLSIGIRVFILEIYSVPSGSMEDTILPGDKVILNKLSYGPRMPSNPFEIPWINLAFYLNREYRARPDSIWWKYKRFRGFSNIKHNQIVVFNSPKAPKEILIKRCTGIPGDTLLLMNGKVLVNHTELPEKGTIKLFSRIRFSNYALASSLFDSLGLVAKDNKPVGTNYFSTYLNYTQKHELLNYKFIDSIIIEKNRPDTAYHTFPRNNYFRWSIDNFGPLVIPAKGMTIMLNEENYILYNRVITLFEKVSITTHSGKYFLNGAETTSITFRNNYYFMLGDNRHDSNDSRYWGFVPEQYIIGKAVMILFSNGDDGFRWRRLFKIIS
jgi:signal peptidase I